MSEPADRETRDLADDLDPATVVRHEETMTVEKQPVEVGTVRAHKQVETVRVAEDVPRDVEHADVERVAAAEHDSGKVETLPDGSVSIPILEEELVVTKRTVVRERVIIRKRTITEHHRVEADLRRERVEVDPDPEVSVEAD